MLAQRPFSHAQIRDVVFDSANCFVTANFSVLPRYQLGGLTQPLRLKMKFPAPNWERVAMPPDKVSSTSSFSVDPEEHALPDGIISDMPFAPLPFRVLDSVMIHYGSRTSRLAICHGDLTPMPPSEAVDVLVVSSFPDEYGPAPGSVIGALHDKGVSVKRLAQCKAVDLRTPFPAGCPRKFQPLRREFLSNGFFALSR